MLDPDRILDEKLLQEEVPHDFCGGRRILPLLLFISGCCFAVIHCPVLHLGSQRSTISMAATIASTPWFKRWGGWGAPDSRTVYRQQPLTIARVEGSRLPVRKFFWGKLSRFMNSTAGVPVPRLMYRIPLKKEITKKLVIQAVQAGFQGIDIPYNLRRGSNENEVGEALSLLFSAGVPRTKLFIQAQLNSIWAAELSLGEPIKTQVANAIERTLSNLGVDYLDSLVLQSVSPEIGETMEVWHAMEDAVQAGFVRQLGLEVHYPNDLGPVFESATIKPAVVQQPYFYPEMFNAKMAKFKYQHRALSLERELYEEEFKMCRKVKILPQAVLDTRSDQGKYLLYKRGILRGSRMWTMKAIAKKYGVSVERLYYRFFIGLGGVATANTDAYDILEDVSKAWEVPLSTADAMIIYYLLEK